jgi:isochorismate hydrolase
MQNGFGVDLIRVAQTALRFENNGVLPDKYRTLATDWNPVTLSNPAVTSDAITKQIAAGSVPATSDVTLKRLGYSAVERARLEQDRKRADGRAAAQAIAASLTPPTAPVVPGDNAGL